MKSYTVTDALPFYKNNPLYISNKRTVYVDVAKSTQNPITDTFDNLGAVDETTTVSVYFVNDAKSLPSDYDASVNAMKLARTATGTEGFVQKLVSTDVSYEDDNLITILEFSFRKTITN
jgi:hypothetical protein